VKHDVLRATLCGVVVTLTLTVLIVLGSRNLSHFDAVLAGYILASLLATFAIAYRYAIWLQRPPTALYWRRGWQTFLNPRYALRNLAASLKRLVTNVALNRFILYRGRLRWLAHWLIMWGCISAAAITFPLVFGWLHFDSVPGNPEWYHTVLFGFPLFAFPIHSLVGFMLFHGLVWSSFLVIGGVLLALRRRIRDAGAASVQLFAEDFLPLILLFAVSATGLMLTASYTWMKGYGYDFLAILHAVTVIFLLLWLPFGKFFHIFQQPAQIGVQSYKDVGRRVEPALCRRCGQPFTSRMHVEDLIQVERALGYRYEMPGSDVEHYQWICPPCRRAMLALAQGRLWHVSQGIRPTTGKEGSLPPTPRYVTTALGEGPLGEEDSQNFHL
jgi:hypothetical protein